AVRLFGERASMARRGFRLAEPEDAIAVAQICQRLDGIPLAIELAAARTTVLPVAQIAARLDNRFQLLTAGSTAALPRHRTLRALIDWSYDSLPAPEAALLRRLSVFAGSWTLDAAEAVCSDAGTREAGDVSRQEPSSQPTAITLPAGDTRLLPTDVLDLLDSLEACSLVLVDESAEGLRYRMLETVREYGRER